MRLLTALTSFAGTQLRQASSQGLWVIENEDQEQWLEWLLVVRPHLSVHWHENTTVWQVISAMNDAGLQQPLTHVMYTYDPPGSPESLNAARMSASRLNATMIDATLLAEAESAGFKPAEAVALDGVHWLADVSDMTNERVQKEWLPRMQQGSVGLEQFTQRTYHYQNDVAAAWEVLSWTPDCGSEQQIRDTRGEFLGKLVNESLVFGLSHTPQDESDMVHDTSARGKILTISEGSFNVALLSSFRTNSPGRTLVQKPIHDIPTGRVSKHYVAFMMNDGDGLDYWLSGQQPGGLSGFWNDRRRGSLPLGWGMSGQFRDLAQPVVESLYANASRTARGYDDFFMQDGYSTIIHYAP
jgi:hypothetical protein